MSQHHNKHLDSNRNNVCEVCHQGFTRPENLKKHMTRPHTFPCQLCAKSFIAVDRLERHCLNEHRSGDSKAGERVLCELCGKNFRQLHILRKHKEIEHKHPCHMCTKRFTMRSWLRQHLKAEHTEVAEEPMMEQASAARKALPDLIKIYQEPVTEEVDMEEEEEVPSPWENIEQDLEEEVMVSEGSSIASLLSQELLEPQVQIEEWGEEEEEVQRWGEQEEEVQRWGAQVDEQVQEWVEQVQEQVSMEEWEEPLGSMGGAPGHRHLTVPVSRSYISSFNFIR